MPPAARPAHEPFFRVFLSTAPSPHFFSRVSTLISRHTSISSAMDSFGAARKRGRPDAANGNGGFAGSKRPRETDSVQSGLGSKSKPCMKFFSITGCPFGEGCHFMHYVPGGYNAVLQMTNMGNTALHTPARGPMGPPISDSHGPPSMKTKMCNKYNSADGCKFGDTCRFAHGERELGKPIAASHEGHMAPPPMGGGRMGGRLEPPAPASNFGASATTKISLNASLAGAIIGKGGVNTKHICRVTGVKLAIREHDSDENLRNIELEGTFDQISSASAMVQELVMNLRSTAPPAKAAPVAPHAAHQSSYLKTKLCENFTKGTCTFGDRCHFAHGANELRKSAA